VDPYRSVAPEPAPPARAVPALVRAQLLLGGPIREIGLLMLCAALAAVLTISPTFDANPEYGGLFASLVIGLIGLGMVLGSIPGGLRTIRLLRSGTLATGCVTDVRVRRSGRPHRFAEWHPVEWTATFEFETADGATSRSRAATRTEPSLDDEADVIYDPRWPDHSAVLDYLPGRPQIEGDVVSLGAARPVGAALAFVALALLVVDLFVVLRR
jgi:hypothetical protein